MGWTTGFRPIAREAVRATRAQPLRQEPGRLIRACYHFTRSLMPISSQLTGAPEVEALRAELRCILHHPAITPDRRQFAEQYISRCMAAGQLRQWLELAVAECASWEEQTLAMEATQCGGHRLLL